MEEMENIMRSLGELVTFKFVRTMDHAIDADISYKLDFTMSLRNANS